MGAFNQIVAEQCFRGKTASEAGVKGSDVVDRLAMIDRVLEQILLRVGDRLAIRIGSRRIRKHSREQSEGSIRQGDAHPRLNDGEASLPGLGHRIEFGVVERMSHRFHQTAAGAGRKLRIGIQRDHVADRHLESPG